jgi:hypothetical protein
VATGADDLDFGCKLGHVPAGRALPFFFVLAFGRWAQAGRGPESFAEVIHRQALHVQRKRAASSLLVDHNDHGATFDAFLKPKATPTDQARTFKALQHGRIILQAIAGFPTDSAEGWKRREGMRRPEFYNSDLRSDSKSAFVPIPMWVLHQVPSRSIQKLIGRPHTGPQASWNSSSSRPTSIG